MVGYQRFKLNEPVGYSLLWGMFRDEHTDNLDIQNNEATKFLMFSHSVIPSTQKGSGMFGEGV